MNMFKYIDGTLKKAFQADYVKHARFLLLVLLGILVLPVVLTQLPISFFDFSETGQIGDTIGGITAPFIGVIAGYLTFLAFHEQYRANDKAQKDYLKERFESKFYNFLSLLNTLEINTNIPHVGNYKQAFHFMFYEYKAIAVLTYRRLNMKTPETTAITKDMREKILKDSFGIFINGVSRSATSRMKEYIDGSETLNDYFLELQHLYSKPKNGSVPYLDDYSTTDIKLFDGHRLRLISFFRLICKILELIYEDGGDEKEIYLSTLLSLLSEHQIALLKILYKYDEKEHERFITTHKEEIKSFFMDPYNMDENPEKVCISKYIFSDIMDCSKPNFINYNNKVGVLVPHH